MLAGFVTRQTLLSEPGHVALRFVNVVAGRARQVRARAKASAAAQQRDLIPVNVGDRKLPFRRGQGKVGEGVTGAGGERRAPRGPPPGEGKSANVHPAVLGKAGG